MSRQATRDAYESREIVDEEELKEEERRLRNKLELDKIQARQTRDDRQRLLDELQGSMKQMRP
jgi:hypothetical protein